MAATGARRRWRGPVGGAVAGGFLGALVIGGILVARDGSADPTPDAAPVPATAAAAQSPNHVFDRTTAAGITLRVYRSTGPADPADEGLPEPCRSTGTLEATAIGRAAVTTARSLTTSGPRTQPNTGIALGGSVEDDPILAVVVQVPDGVDEVTLAGRNDATDSMRPVDEVVALAVPVPAALALAYSGLGAPSADLGTGSIWRGIELQLHHRDGSSERITGADLGEGPGIWDDPACQLGLDEPTRTTTA